MVQRVAWVPQQQLIFVVLSGILNLNSINQLTHTCMSDQSESGAQCILKEYSIA